MSELRQRLFVQRNDSALGNWCLSVLMPPPVLAEAVEMMWCVEGGNAFEVARILPRGNAHLMFNLGAAQRVLDVHGVRAPVHYELAWLSGQQHSYLDIDATGPNAVIGVRFRSLGAWRILGIPQDMLSGQVLDLDALLGDRIHSLRQRLVELPDHADKFRHFEAWLIGQARERANPHYAVRWAEQRLRATHGAIEIQDLATELCISRKHLVTLFQREIGLSPKALSRVLRFSHTLCQLRTTVSPQLDTLALDCGYFDQSHMIREFQEFSGHAPRSFLLQAAFDEESISGIHKAADV